MRAIFSICLVLLTGLVAPGHAQAEGGGAFTVFVARHAEKADTSRDAELSDAGRSRAVHLAKLLQDADVEYVHSTDFKRTTATANPTAEKINAKVNLYAPGALPDLVAEIRRRRGRHLVVGHTNTVLKTVELLGGDPGFPLDEGSEFDRLYVVTVSARGEVTTILMRYGSP